MSKNIVIMSFVLVSVIGCAQGGGGSGEAPMDPKQLDVASNEITKDGCLNLELLRKKMSAFPSQAQVRRSSTTFDMQPTSESEAVRRAFLSLNAFSNYIYQQAGISEVMDEMPKISQKKCESVTLATRLEGAKKYRIVMAEKQKTTVLHLENDDGTSMTWQWTGLRGFEVTIKGPVMDPCPHYAKAISTSTVQWVWGSKQELENTPARISRQYLRVISTAVVDMPEELLNLATYDEKDSQIRVSAVELKGLRSATVDPQMYQCPYRANPPSGDEPPPSNDGNSQPPEPDVPMM